MQNDLISVILFIALIFIYCIHSKCKKKKFLLKIECVRSDQMGIFCDLWTEY